MTQWSYYNERTGILSRKKNSAPAGESPTPPEGFIPIEGDLDPLSQRVDLQTGAVIDYQPQAPSDDHAWNESTRRWELRPEVSEAIQRDAQARARIAELEISQARRVREFLADSDAQLKAIDDEIAALRPQLRVRPNG